MSILAITPQNLSDIYTLTIGYHSDQYMCTSVGRGCAEFRRVRLGKSKIDNTRLPERITISLFSKLYKNKQP